MSHIINATAFRLGKTKKSMNIWVKNQPNYQNFFIKDLYIFQFIKFFFMMYNIPVFSLNHIRNKSTGNDDIFPNPWGKNGFAFSSCKIIRNVYLGIDCIFLDAIMEEIRTKSLRSIKANTYFKFKKWRRFKWNKYNDIWYKRKKYKLFKFKTYKNKKFKKRKYKWTRFEYHLRKWHYARYIRSRKIKTKIKNLWLKLWYKKLKKFKRLKRKFKRKNIQIKRKDIKKLAINIYTKPLIKNLIDNQLYIKKIPIKGFKDKKYTKKKQITKKNSIKNSKTKKRGVKNQYIPKSAIKRNFIKNPFIKKKAIKPLKNKKKLIKPLKKEKLLIKKFINALKHKKPLIKKLTIKRKKGLKHKYKKIKELKSKENYKVKPKIKTFYLNVRNKIHIKIHPVLIKRNFNKKKNIFNLKKFLNTNKNKKKNFKIGKNKVNNLGYVDVLRKSTRIKKKMTPLTKVEIKLKEIHLRTLKKIPYNIKNPPALKKIINKSNKIKKAKLKKKKLFITLKKEKPAPQKGNLIINKSHNTTSKNVDKPYGNNQFHNTTQKNVNKPNVNNPFHNQMKNKSYQSNNYNAVNQMKNKSYQSSNYNAVNQQNSINNLNQKQFNNSQRFNKVNNFDSAQKYKNYNKFNHAQKYNKSNYSRNYNKFNYSRNYNKFNRFYRSNPLNRFKHYSKKIDLKKNYGAIQKHKKIQKRIQKKILKHYPYSLYALKKKILYIKSTRVILYEKNLKLLKILLRIFKQKIASWKQQFFFIILLKKIILSIINLQKKRRQTFKLFRIINLLTIKEFSYKHLNINFFKKIFRYRYLIFQNASSIIYNAIRAFDKTQNIKLSFSSAQIKKISAAQICNYITIKLGQYFKLYEVLQPTIRKLKYTNMIKGFRILIVGRLTRKERAAHIVKKHGSVPLSKKDKYIDYASDYKVMRFGVVGVKIWLYTKDIAPYFYTFKFNINPKF